PTLPAGSEGRWAPQRRTAAILDAAGIAYVDLLEPLRRVPNLPSGRQAVYHLRDTHFNAKGNQVVADALAAYLRSRYAGALRLR
ncbi:MAG: hypothetical protein AAF628_29630, partial [Planctomycetota bacterium]